MSNLHSSANPETFTTTPSYFWHFYLLLQRFDFRDVALSPLLLLPHLVQLIVEVVPLDRHDHQLLLRRAQLTLHRRQRHLLQLQLLPEGRNIRDVRGDLPFVRLLQRAQLQKVKFEKGRLPTVLLTSCKRFPFKF
jgi:hypothetical protein